MSFLKKFDKKTTIDFMLHLTTKAVMLVLLSTLPATVFAESCLLSTDYQKMSLHNPEKSLAQEPKVAFQLKENTLTALFEIVSEKINAKEKLKPGEYPFMFDVAELFISVENPNLQNSDHYPYYEFEISPYGNSFEVLIRRHGKSNINDIHVGTKYQTKIEKIQMPIKNSLKTKAMYKWTAKMEIPLEKLNWSGKINQLFGNAYVISGEKPNKYYFSLNLPNMPKPNFHQPKYFKSLFDKNIFVDSNK